MHEMMYFGSEKLYGMIKERFHWPNLYNYIQVHVTTCEICQKCKANNRPPKAPLVPMHIPELTMQFISIDIAHMATSTSAYAYMLVIGDLFTKYVLSGP